MTRDAIATDKLAAPAGPFSLGKRAVGLLFPVKPVRATVGSDLAAGMRVEMTVIARRPGRAASAVPPAGR